MVPMAQVVFDGRLVWATSDPVPTRESLGLSSELLSCDRMSYRYRVTDTAGFVQWDVWKRDRVHPLVSAQLEHGCVPESWWVSEGPVPVVLG